MFCVRTCAKGVYSVDEPNGAKLHRNRDALTNERNQGIIHDEEQTPVNNDRDKQTIEDPELKKAGVSEARGDRLTRNRILCVSVDYSYLGLFGREQSVRQAGQRRGTGSAGERVVRLTWLKKKKKTTPSMLNSQQAKQQD